MITVMNAKYTVPGWHVEGEIIATLHQAELYFSIGTRSIVAFACAVSCSYSAQSANLSFARSLASGCLRP